ncbi:N-glycosylation protein-domain-containing protein [Podospora didyma]|uniref:N-glycosylation protein-domain-containing protein n=1 Tax=Podospora didyma TaxID=330526 RepID=A0AAE0P4F2_9PEZI|nr:N-glycosylation protein-domain-containing protein [Podospora didyma]
MSNRARATAPRRVADNSSSNDNNGLLDHSPYPNNSSNLKSTSTSSTLASRRASNHHNSHTPTKQQLDGNHAATQGGHVSSHDGATDASSFTNGPGGGGADSDDDPSAATAHSSMLQPRVAVVLGVAKTWHPLLFACRLLSIVPAIWWGLPIALRLLAMIRMIFFGWGVEGSPASSCTSNNKGFLLATAINCHELPFEARLRLTETLLATIWCGASGYLSFFFTDCLMSRWLLNYTPQATLVRLLTTSALNGYLSSWVLFITGGSEDPRLLLPAWIGISTTLTVMYHVTQRKINIRKETSMSISVFSIASFISMVALLAQLHSNRSDYPNIPLVTFTRRAIHEAGKLALSIMEYSNATRDL